MIHLIDFLTESNKEQLGKLFDLSRTLDLSSINVKNVNLNDSDLLDRIAAPIIEFSIFDKFDRNTGDYGIFSKVSKAKAGSLWDFTAKLDKDSILGSKVEDLPFDKTLTFEIKAFKDGKAHNITLTKPQIEAIQASVEDVYFILVDYSTSGGDISINNVYFTDADTMKQVIGAKSVKSSAFKKIVLK